MWLPGDGEHLHPQAQKRLVQNKNAGQQMQKKYGIKSVEQKFVRENVRTTKIRRKNSKTNMSAERPV